MGFLPRLLTSADQGNEERWARSSRSACSTGCKPEHVPSNTHFPGSVCWFQQSATLLLWLRDMPVSFAVPAGDLTLSRNSRQTALKAAPVFSSPFRKITPACTASSRFNTSPRQLHTVPRPKERIRSVSSYQKKLRAAHLGLTMSS